VPDSNDQRIRRLARGSGLSVDAIKHALLEAERSGIPLTSALIERDVMPEKALEMVCADAGLMPVPDDWMQGVLDLPGSDFDGVLLWRIPAVPFGWEGDYLKVGFTRPEDAKQEGLLGPIPVIPHLALETMVLAGLFRLVGGPPESDTQNRTKRELQAAETLSLSWTTDAGDSRIRSDTDQVWKTSAGESRFKSGAVPISSPEDTLVTSENLLGRTDLINDGVTMPGESTFKSEKKTGPNSRPNAQPDTQIDGKPTGDSTGATGEEAAAEWSELGDSELVEALSWKLEKK
jgi:hypothetical protein